MFGYLQIRKSELLVREYEAYKAVYCGLCKQMGKEYSFASRFFLSYDCTFYTMLLMSVQKSCKGFKKGRCVFNPMKACSFAQDLSDSYSKSAAFAVISAYYKLKDDISDSGFFKGLLCRLLLPFFSHWRKKAAKKFPQTEALTAEMMLLQNKAETEKNPSIDSAAHPTANMLGSLFKLEANGEAEERVFYEFGYQIGRWIYLIDAADDIEKDKKSRNFNPFLNTNQETNPEKIVAILNQSLARAYDAYNLIELTDFKGILDNMILKGFPTVQNNITDRLFKEETNE